jgi:hypothetical protein
MLGGEMVVGKPAGKPPAPAADADAGEIVVTKPSSRPGDEGEIVVTKPSSRPTDAGELVVTQPASRPKDAGELVVTQRPSTPAVGPSVVPGMQLALGGVALVALSLLLNIALNFGMLDYGLPLGWLIRPAGLVLFAVGCMRSTESAAGLAALWARRAGVVGWVAAALAILMVVFTAPEGEGIGGLMLRISPVGVFMLALACQAAFLIHLAVGLGLRFKADAAMQLLWLWVLLAFGRFIWTWANYGYVQPWIDAATLLGLAVWFIFQFSMIAKARTRG